MAVLMWRMRRVPMFEAALIEMRREDENVRRRRFPDRFERKETPNETTVIAFQRSENTLGTLLRYEAALTNAFNRTLQQLLFLQDRRARSEDDSDVVEALPLPSNERDTAPQ